MPRRRTALLSSLLLVACATATAAACSSGGDEAQASNEDQGKVVVTGGSAGSSSTGGSAGASGTAAGGKSGASGGGAAGKAGGVVGNPDVTGLVIEPATATIDVVDGVAKPVKFTAKPKYANGTVGNAIGPTWQVDLGDVANVDKDGNVTAAGARGGLVTLGASWQSYKATATVTVKLHLTVNPGKLSDADKTKLAGATDADTIPWMYPYDATVFPRGLSAPRLMWGAAPAAPMMFTAKGEFAEITSYFNETAPGHQPDATLWTKLTESGSGGPVQVQVARLDATGKAKVVMKQTWRIAAGNLKGTVYYWANSLGRVVRIKPGAAAPDDFLKAAGQNDGCTTCHAVSANGNVLTLGGGKAQAPEDSAWSVYDLAGNKLVAKDRGRPWAMLALTPDGKFAALNNAPLPGGPGLDGGFYDVTTGAKVPGSGFDTELFDMPSFSPDGTRLVYVDHATKGLVSLSFSQATGKPVASGKVPLVPASGDPKLNLIAFPVVSPDGKWAVYHRGPLDTRDGPADLVATSAVAAGPEMPLDATNGKTYPFAAGDRDRHLNYEPTFLPVASGGYYWLIFTSRRTLGNQATEGKDKVKQLWVAAFDQNPTPGKDPSHAAFWLSGQDLATLNMRGYWALDPCKADGQACGLGSECCNGSCLAGDGGMVCGKPPGQSCTPAGSLCKVDKDCCGNDVGFTCINGHCAEPPPK